jgi:hypothetical protein
MERFRSSLMFGLRFGVALSMGDGGFFPRLSVSANRKVYAFFIAYSLLVSFQCKNY